MKAATWLPTKHWIKRIPLEVWILGAWWLLYASLDALTAKALNLQGYPPITWREAFAYAFARATPINALGLAFYFLLIRRPLLGSWPGAWHIMVSIIYFITTSLVIAALNLWVFTDIVYWRDVLRVAQPTYWEVLRIYFGPTAAYALYNILLVYGFAYYRQALSRGKALGELQGALARTRLHALRAQLNPHFLFNALNSIGEAMHHDVAAADRMVVSLSSLLRDRLAADDSTQLRPLREELALVRDYLNIEEMRLGSRLQQGWQADAAALQIQVPALSVQTLVENAILHGISRAQQPGHLLVHARRQGDRLRVEVGNSIPQGAGNPKAGTGFGLKSVVERLRLIYGDDASLTREERDGGWYWVALDLPVVSPGVEVA